MVATEVSQSAAPYTSLMPMQPSPWTETVSSPSEVVPTFVITCPLPSPAPSQPTLVGPRRGLTLRLLAGDAPLKLVKRIWVGLAKVYPGHAVKEDRQLGKHDAGQADRDHGTVVAPQKRFELLGLPGAKLGSHDHRARRDALDLLFDQRLPPPSRLELALVEPRPEPALAELVSQPPDGRLVGNVMAEEDVKFLHLLLALQYRRGGRNLALQYRRGGGILAAAIGRGVHLGGDVIGVGGRLIVVAKRDPSFANGTQDVIIAAPTALFHLLGSEPGLVVGAGVQAQPFDRAAGRPAF